MMGRRLYVGNLPYTTGEAELQELFSRAGTVESVRVMRDAATGRARGFAFVEMSTDEEAQKAANALNQFQMGGRAVTVNEARPKPEGGFGGGGGGFGGNRGGGGGGRREPRWELDEIVDQGRPRRPTNLRPRNARRGQRTPHGDRLRRARTPHVRDPARHTAVDQRAGPEQAGPQTRRSQDQRAQSEVEPRPAFRARCTYVPRRAP